jgi:hypothetical protein
LSSLQLVQELPDLELLAAHGPLGRRSHERTEELLAHHRERLEATSRGVCDGPCSAFDVARGLSWTSRQRAFADLDPQNQLLAVSETAAHLDVLVRDQVLTARNDDGVRTYSHSTDGGTLCVPR